MLCKVVHFLSWEWCKVVNHSRCHQQDRPFQEDMCPTPEVLRCIHIHPNEQHQGDEPLFKNPVSIFPSELNSSWEQSQQKECVSDTLFVDFLPLF